MTSYTWDYRDRLANAHVVNASGATVSDTSYLYDALDNRVAVTSGTTTTLAVADNGTPLADLDTSGAAQKLYLSGPAVDELLASVDADGSVLWYLSDVRGSIRQALDSSGIEQYRISYDPFGIITTETNPSVGGKFKYTGREFDPVTNLQYNRARYYDALSGRFLSEDPSGFTSGDPNFYRYGGNSPTNATDPSGLRQNSADIDKSTGETTITGSRGNPDSVATPSRSWGQTIEYETASFFGDLGRMVSHPREAAIGLERLTKPYRLLITACQ